MSNASLTNMLPAPGLVLRHVMQILQSSAHSRLGEVWMIKVTHTHTHTHTYTALLSNTNLLGAEMCETLLSVSYARSMKHTVESEMIRIFTPDCQLFLFPWANSVLAQFDRLVLSVYSEPITEWDILLLFSHSAVSDSLRPHGLQHTRLEMLEQQKWTSCSASSQKFIICWRRKMGNQIIRVQNDVCCVRCLQGMEG